MKPRELVWLGVVGLSALSGGCTPALEAGPDTDAFKAAGMDPNDLAVFRKPETTTVVRFGDRRLVVAGYPVVHREEDFGHPHRTPHFVVAEAPCVWGFGPVIVSEGRRVLLWSHLDVWWILTDLGGQQPISLLIAYDNYALEGPVELHILQEPRTPDDRMTWLFFTWLPMELSKDGFILRPIRGQDTVRLAVETLQDGRCVNVGEIRLDPVSESIQLHMKDQTPGPTSAKAPTSTSPSASSADVVP